jgi:uncharacterized protein (DUF1501 family)
MHLTRRDLLKSTAIAGASLALPGIGSAAGITPRVLPNGRILVLVELDGGNDGLNTVVPYDDPNYVSNRPSLLYSDAQLTAAGTKLGTASTYTKGAKNGTLAPVTRNFGLNPSLSQLMASWTGTNGVNGDLAIALGVGYANPNLSHFRSIDIWNSGSDANVFLTEGWLGRVLANNPSLLTGFTADAVLLERFSSNPLAKPGIRYLAMSTPKDFIQQSWSLRDTPGSTTNVQLQHLMSVQHDVYGASGAFRSALMTPKGTLSSPPVFSDYNYTPSAFAGATLTFNAKSSFEQQCLHTAEMIATAVNTNKLTIPIYKLHLGGFDNHAGQKAKHEDLLAQLGSGLSSLRAALKSPSVNLWDQVVVMTYSEFGRRVEQNGSAGTDHGTANCHFIMGGKVQGGFYGMQPGLVSSDWNTTNGDLDGRGNLISLVDQRHLYKKVTGWMGLTPDAAIATPPAPGGGLPADPLVNLFKP